MWVWFEPELLPGYAWSFPLPGGIANVGFGVRRRPGERTGALADQWRRLVELPHVRATLGEDAVPFAAGVGPPLLLEQELKGITRKMFGTDARVSGYLRDPWAG